MTDLKYKKKIQIFLKDIIEYFSAKKSLVMVLGSYDSSE